MRALWKVLAAAAFHSGLAKIPWRKGNTGLPVKAQFFTSHSIEIAPIGTAKAIRCRSLHRQRSTPATATGTSARATNTNVYLVHEASPAITPAVTRTAARRDAGSARW